MRLMNISMLESHSGRASGIQCGSRLTYHAVCLTATPPKLLNEHFWPQNLETNSVLTFLERLQWFGLK